jgi:hypothetical protein
LCGPDAEVSQRHGLNPGWMKNRRPDPSLVAEVRD